VFEIFCTGMSASFFPWAVVMGATVARAVEVANNVR